MLVLTRKKEQKICIGDNIVIKILKVQGDQVSIGIEAPRSLSIVRQELLEENEPTAKQEAQAEALEPQPIA